MKKYLLIIFFLIIQDAYAQTLLSGMPQPNVSPRAIEKVDSMVYIGGGFNQVDSIPHAFIASFNSNTGQLSNWNPGFDGSVNSITRVADKLIVGGSFDSVNAQSRLGLCMFDLATGNLNPWNDFAYYPSYTVGVGAYNNTFYYASVINHWGNLRIVCVDALTGNFTSWQSDSILSGDINAIYASGSYVYVGGYFLFAKDNSAHSSVYNDLCRFSQSTGELDTSWHPQPVINNSSFGITSIVGINGNTFVGGMFDTICGQSRLSVAGFDSSGKLTNFSQNSSSDEVFALYPDGDYIWVGGNSWMLGSQSRWRIAQIRISNSVATCWDASATSSSWGLVDAIYVSGDTVYLGPGGTPHLSVFINSPLPQIPDTIVGPTSVINYQMATYSVPFNAGHTYNWRISGGTGTTSTNSINVIWGNVSTGTVAVVENNPSHGNCYSDTVVLPVSISPSCRAAFSIAADTSQVHHYLITDSSTGRQPLKYRWSWGDGSPDDTIPYPSHTYTDSGFYTICVSITDSLGCTSNFCDSSFHALRTTNTMVYVNVVNPLVTGTKEVSILTPQVSLYPNPATNQLTIHIPILIGTVTVSVMNVFGQETSPPQSLTPALSKGEGVATIDVSKLPAGIYFLQMKSKSGSVVKKFVKE